MQSISTPFRCCLTTRSLLQLTGSEVYDFLQGLFTNDVRQLREARSMWGCFLFYSGRVFCDAYLYSSSPKACKDNATVLIDVHRDYTDLLLDYLLEMRMRRKIAIDNVSHRWGVMAALHTCKHGVLPIDDATRASNRVCPVLTPNGSSSLAITNTDTSTDAGIVADTSEVTTSHMTSSPGSAELPDSDAEVFVDARNFAVQRVLQSSICSSWTRSGNDTPVPPSSLSAVSPDNASTLVPEVKLYKIVCPLSACLSHSATSTASYDSLLLRCGIGEGPNVFKHDKTLPFETNADFLGGISFHKGCYVGQELTHRTHVMLVTRRRTVALHFDRAQAVSISAPSSSSSSASVPEEVEVCVGDGLYLPGGDEKVGEVTSVCGCFGLGLIRLRYVDPETRVIAGMQLKNGAAVRMSIPPWWPAKEVKKLLKNN